MTCIPQPLAENPKSTCREAGKWFLKSGIQEYSGGVARYHYSDRRQNARLTTEITGYFASALVCLSKHNPEAGYLEAAINAAEYLVNAWDATCSAMPFECEAESCRYSYFFDTGIIVRGLLAVWRECGKPELLSTAIRCGDSMMRDFANGTNFSPILELPGKAHLAYEAGRWSRSPGCYQLKAALAWHELWQLTQEQKYLDAYRQLLGPSVAAHSAFLPVVEDDCLVMDRLHAYSYFLEGLLPVLNEPECMQATVEGIERLAGFVERISPLFLRSDVVAQLLRARLFAEQYGVLPLDEAAAQREATILQGFQSEDPDSRLYRGFWFGRKNGEFLPFMNPVSTAFSYQALDMWDHRGRQTTPWVALI